MTNNKKKTTESDAEPNQTEWPMSDLKAFIKQENEEMKHDLVAEIHERTEKKESGKLKRLSPHCPMICAELMKTTKVCSSKIKHHIILITAMWINFPNPILFRP